MLSLYHSTVDSLFDNLVPRSYGGKSVYVISDSEYKRYRRQQALDEIAVLEQRAQSYESTAASIRNTIHELKVEAGLDTTDTDANVTEM